MWDIQVDASALILGVRQPSTCLFGSAHALHQTIEGGLAALDGQELSLGDLQGYTEE